MKIFIRRVAPTRDEIGHVYIKVPAKVAAEGKDGERETKVKTTIKVKMETKEIRENERYQK